MLEKIGRDFLFGRVLEAAAAPSITQKLEEFLRVVEEQRAKNLRRTPGLPSDAIFTKSDMQKIHSEWMNDSRAGQPASARRFMDAWEQEKSTALLDSPPRHQVVLHSPRHGGSWTRGSRRSRQRCWTARLGTR